MDTNTGNNNVLHRMFVLSITVKNIKTKVLETNYYAELDPQGVIATTDLDKAMHFEDKDEAWENGRFLLEHRKMVQGFSVLPHDVQIN